MLKIRLKRTGKKGQPHYRVVVAQAHKSRNSQSVEEIGYYNPRTKPSTLKLETERVKYWLEKGAQPTDTMAQLFVKEGLMKKLKKGSTLSAGKKKKKVVEEKPEEKKE